MINTDQIFGFNRSQWMDYANYLVRHGYADKTVIAVVYDEFR